MHHKHPHYISFAQPPFIDKYCQFLGYCQKPHKPQTNWLLILVILVLLACLLYNPTPGSQ